MSVRERFNVKYVVNSETDCWEWTARRDGGGYGRLQVGGRTKLAHRVAYELYVGEIACGLELDHLRRVRHCVNPDHLEPVTPRENVLRSDGPTAINAAKTSCDSGHPFDAVNTYLRPDGGRECRTCRRNSHHAYRARLGDEYRARKREHDRAFRARAKAKRERASS